MKKLMMALSVAMFFASANAFSAVSELSNHAHLAQPTQSKAFYKTQLVNRYVLSDYEEVTYHNLMRSVIRDLGSDKSKRVHLIWKDKVAKKSAVKIRNVLMKRGIDSKRVVLERQDKHAVYPLYVEIARVGAKKANCRVNTGEDMMSWDGQDSCASKNNHRIQLKY